MVCGLKEKALHCNSSSEWCRDKGVEKNFQTFLWKCLELNEKSPIFAAAFGIRKTFGVDRSMPWSPDDWNEVLKKKFEKKMQKDLEGRIKSAYLCIRFRSQNGAGQRTKKKEFFKDIERLKQTASASPREEIQWKQRLGKGKRFWKFLYYEEFDPGSGWTLATGLTHASRGASDCSNTMPATGARVSNAYATYPIQGNSPWKRGLTPHETISRHLVVVKSSEVSDGHASY